MLLLNLGHFTVLQLIIDFFLSKKGMANIKDALLRQAEMMFIELGITAKQIAAELDVTEQTVGRWRQKNQWDKRRDELFGSPHKLREILLKEMRHIADGGEPRFNTDALAKVNKVFESFGNKVTPGTAYSVIKLLDEWLAEANPKLASENLPFHKRFILHLINLHG